jgi:hypothetical protein
MISCSKTGASLRQLRWNVVGEGHSAYITHMCVVIFLNGDDSISY